MAAAPPRSRTRALTNTLCWVPKMLAGYLVHTAGEASSAPGTPGLSVIQGDRTTPVMSSDTRGPAGGLPSEPS